MIESTECESAELDGFPDELESIRPTPIREIEHRKPREQNDTPESALHTAAVTAEQWPNLCLRERATFPAPCPRDVKFCPLIACFDDVRCLRTLVCTRPLTESYA